MAREGSSGVENTLRIRTLPSSTHTQSVKVPPVSMASGKNFDAKREAARGMRTVFRSQELEQQKRDSSTRKHFCPPLARMGNTPWMASARLSSRPKSHPSSQPGQGHGVRLLGAGNVSEGCELVQLLCHEQRIQLAQVVARNDLHDEVIVPLVEANRRIVVHGGLEQDGTAAGGAQARFRRGQQLRADTLATSFRQHVDGHDVTRAALEFLRHEEAKNSGLRGFRYQRERAGMVDVMGQFLAAIGDSGRKALLVNAPELVKVGRTMIAQRIRSSFRLMSSG